MCIGTGTKDENSIDRNMKKKFIVCFVRSYMYFTLK